MIYPSVSSAVVCALAAESRSKTAAWQKLYDAAQDQQRNLASCAGSARTDMDRAVVDYWVAARLHHMLIPRHWHALVAKFSTDKVKVVEAIGFLRPLIATPAPALFLYKALTAWAIPKRPGQRARPSRTVSVEIGTDWPKWRQEAAAKAAVHACLSEQRKALSRAAGVIALPDSFYDMNSWDTDGTPDSTRRRWRADITTKLDEMVSEALDAAQELLQMEGVLSDSLLPRLTSMGV